MPRFCWALLLVACWLTGTFWRRWAFASLVYAGPLRQYLFIPTLTVARPGQSWHPAQMTSSFFNACRMLWRDGETRFSLVGTSLFWGAGVTLRFLLVLWVPIALGITDNKTPTYLNAMVAIGIVFGAGAAAKLVTLKTVGAVCPPGADWCGGGLFLAATCAITGLTLADRDGYFGRFLCGAAECAAAECAVKIRWRRQCDCRAEPG